MLDFADTTVAKSDQLNADDLIMGPVVVQITKIVERGNDDQPFDVHVTGGFKPWRPCKTMRRLLVACWGKSGPNGENYIGRWVKLYRDPTSKWAGEEVGGVRVSHLSHIDGPKDVALNESKAGSSKKSKKMWHIEPMKPPTEGAQQNRVAVLRRWATMAVKEHGWTQEQVVGVLGGRKVADIPDVEHEVLIARLKGNPPADPPTLDPAITAALERGVRTPDIEAILAGRDPKDIPESEAAEMVAKIAALEGSS